MSPKPASRAAAEAALQEQQAAALSQGALGGVGNHWELLLLRDMAGTQKSIICVTA